MKSLPILSACILGAAIIGFSRVPESFLLAQNDASPATEATDTKVDTDTPAPKSAVSLDGKAAVALLQKSREKLLNETESVSATLRETVSMGPRQFKATGSYVAGKFPKLRLDLTIDVGGTQGQLIEVCDGAILWTVQQFQVGSDALETQVSRTVIRDVLEAIEKTSDIPETLLIAGLGVGGLPALLASLERSMTFEAMRELEQDGHKFTVIQGRWSDDYLKRLTGGQKNAELPPFMPDHVRIYFDAETLFPTRILYLRRPTPDSEKFASLLSLEFTDITLNAPVDDSLFNYTPGDATQVRDRTIDFVQMIDKAAAAAMQKSVRPDGSVPISQ